MKRDEARQWAEQQTDVETLLTAYWEARQDGLPGVVQAIVARVNELRPSFDWRRYHPALWYE